MLVVSSSGMRCCNLRLIYPLINRISSFHTPICRSSTEGGKLRAWSEQRGVDIPRKKLIPKNSVLRALKDSVPIDWKMNSLYPCETLELAPHSTVGKKRSLDAAQRAKESVELIANTSELLSKGLSWKGETKADLNYIEIPEPDEETNNKSLSQTIDDVISERDLKKLSSIYRVMVEDNVEFPIEIKEKILSFSCYMAKLDRVRKNSTMESEKALESIINLTTPLSKSMLIVIVRCYAEMGNEVKCKEWFDKLLGDGNNLDCVTASSILKLSSSSVLKSKVLEVMKSQNISPTASGIMSSFPSENIPGHSAKEIATLLSKYIEEAKYCSNNSEIEVLVEALCAVSQKLLNRTVIYALLQRLDSFGNEKVENSDGFMEAMVAADKLQDVELAHKIVETAGKHSMSLPLRFFVMYIACLGKFSTAEVFMENAAGYLGPVVTVNGFLFERIVDLCRKRQWPHVLPLLFSTFDNPVVNHRNYISWLDCATELYDNADEDCISQFRTISGILINLLKLPQNRCSPEFHIRLVSFMAKCEYEEGLRQYLKLADKRPALKNELSYKICERSLETSSL